MDFTGLIAGLIIIATGFLVKLFPILIAGYNTMSKERKENVDIACLSAFMRNGFIVMGLVIMIGYHLFGWIGLNALVEYWIPAVILLGVGVMVIYARRFNHNKEKGLGSGLKKYFVGIVLLYAFGGLAYGLIPTKFHFDNNTIRFSGKYGVEINIDEIGDVQLVEKRPSIKGRTNGLSLGQVRKGFFNVEGLGKTRLLIHSGKGPFLMITTKSGEITIINFKDKDETKMLYNEVKALSKK